MSFRDMNTAELKRVVKICERVHYTHSAESFNNHLYVVLNQALPSVHFTVDHFALGPLSHKEALNNSLPPITFEMFAYFMHQHPGIILYGESQHVGSILTEQHPEQYRKTELYNEVYRPVDIEDQVWMGVGDKEELIAVSFSRDAVYTEQDILTLSLIQSQIKIAWSNWKRIRSLEDQLKGLSRGRIHSERQALNASAVETSIQSLSRRQREVVERVTVGKTNVEIAAEFAISPRTVEKHLERIFAVVGVHTRIALASAAGTGRVGNE